MTPDEIEHALHQFSGTEGLHFSPAWPDITYTDGFQFVLRECKAYWLLGAIAEGLEVESVAKDPITFWTLTVFDNRSAELEVIHDTHEEPMFRSVIPYTDFPLKEFKFYLTGDEDTFVAMLPNEY